MQSKFTNLFSAGILFLLVSLYGGCSNQNHDSADPSVEAGTTLSVDDAVRNLKPDTTARTVTGVVRSVTPEDNLLTLIDVEEYKTCGLSNCCLYMPVHWQGEMPKIEDIVTVQGTIEARDSGMVFSANELRIDGNAASQ